jgi:hypothetical protein
MALNHVFSDCPAVRSVAGSRIPSIVVHGRNQAGNSIWKVPGGGEQADPHNNRPDPRLIQPPPETMVMKKATAYLNKARNPNLFELNGICTGRAHCFWCVTR